MFENTKKEFFVSVIISVITAIFGFFILQLHIEQSFLLSLFLLFLLTLYFHFNNKNTYLKKEIHASDFLEKEYHLLEEKLQSAISKAEKFEKENQTTELFLASMSHEIRTPLNGIVGLTELLDGTELTKEQREFVSMLRESSYNLNVIVNDILDISKLNAGKMELENIGFDLFLKLEVSVGMFVPKIEEKGIVLNLFTDPLIPHHVIGDPTRFSQVIINLVSNAVKFTDKGGKIDLFTEYIEEKDDTVTFKISVNDSGIGLSKEQQVRIFEAYSQAEASTARKAGGTGLGLTISSKILSSMGSELQVLSKEGKGSTFFFILTLPKVKESRKEKLTLSSDLKVGVIYPGNNSKSQWNMILQKYIHYYGAEYLKYNIKDIFTSNCPDILLIEHTLINSDILKKLTSLSCKRVLLTSSIYQADLKKVRHIFDEIIYMPITFEKVGEILQFKKIEDSSLGSERVRHPSTREIKNKNFQNIHVLVAEDNPINQKLIKVVLEKLGLTVTIASNGEKAYEYRKKETYDIIFMDIQMPVMGGVEATQHILAYEKKEGIKHIPIIALTANALSGDKEKYIAKGMDDYATKPLNMQVIEKLVGKYCKI